MSRLRANQITNENANGAPNFPHGLTVTGIVTATTSATTMSQIVVGSAVTANSNGVDTVGIVTAGTLKDKAGGTFAPNPTTTRGDIIIRGVSVNERLAIGTAGQVLKVNAGANGLEYGTDVGGKILQVVATNISATSSLAIPNGSTGTTTSPVNVTITSTVLNSKFLISGMVNGEANNMPDIYFGHVLKRTIGGSVSLVNVGTASGNRSVITRVQNIGHHDDNRTNTPSSNAFAPFLDSPNQAAGTAIKYAFELKSTGSSGTFYYGRTVDDNDGDEWERLPNNITVMEVSP